MSEEEIKQDEVEEEVTDTDEVVEEAIEKEEPTVTVAEMKRRLQKERENAEEKIAESVAEAERLAKMNEDEKKTYELESLQEELAELKRESTYYGLSKEASNMLAEHDLKANDDLLKLLVRDTAEETSTSVNSFVSLFNEHVEQGVKKALAGNSPRVNAGNNKGVTKESIMAIKDVQERIKAINDNKQLFK